MTFKCCLASQQHVKGELNIVADLLSFAGKGRGKGHPLAFDDPSNDELTERFLTALPSQVPENFVISQLPEDILCWVTRVLRVAESYLTGDRKEATKSTTELGDGGRAIVSVHISSLPLCYCLMRTVYCNLLELTALPPYSAVSYGCDGTVSGSYCRIWL
jgi:hypothetical protein